jgi:DNA mismatch repair protein MSH2
LSSQSLIIQLGARECLLPADDKNADYDLVKLKEVIDRCDCVISSVKRSDFTPKSIEQDVNRLLNDVCAGDNLPEFNLKAAMGSMQALLNYLGLLNDNVNFGAFAITTHDLSQYLRLDRSALRALSVFTEPGQGGVNKNDSLFGLLNKCKTSQGTRLLAQWLKQPLVNADHISECYHSEECKLLRLTSCPFMQEPDTVLSVSLSKMLLFVKLCRSVRFGDPYEQGIDDQFLD